MVGSGSGSEYATWDTARLQDFRRELWDDLRKPLDLSRFDPGSDIKDRWHAMVEDINRELEFREFGAK